ncbi:MAG TPA: aldo/keto reductase [Myxococcota bacterium]|nr:aldo/keto reductase [Myxococcota bacterium]
MPDPGERVKLGATPLRVTRLGLGCAPLANLYRASDEVQARAAVDAAWDAGIRWFDTAPLYGHGLSERRLGAALRGRERSEYVVASKVGRLLRPGVDPETVFADVPPLRPVFDFSYDGALRSLEESLTRLGLDRIDLVHVHDPDAHEVEAERGAFRALLRLRDEGVIRAIGAGMNQSPMLARFVERGLVDCVLVAGRWSLLDDSAARDLLPLAERSGVAVIAAGVFNSGILAAPRAGATYDYAPAPPERLARAQRLEAICARFDVSLRAAALQFPLRHPAVRCVLVGARSAEEIADAAAQFTAPIPAELWAALAGE